MLSGKARSAKSVCTATPLSLGGIVTLSRTGIAPVVRVVTNAADRGRSADKIAALGPRQGRR